MTLIFLHFLILLLSVMVYIHFYLLCVCWPFWLLEIFFSMGYFGGWVIFYFLFFYSIFKTKIKIKYKKMILFSDIFMLNLIK